MTGKFTRRGFFSAAGIPAGTILVAPDVFAQGSPGSKTDTPESTTSFTECIFDSGTNFLNAKDLYFGNYILYSRGIKGEK